MNNLSMKVLCEFKFRAQTVTFTVIILLEKNRPPN